MKKLILTLTTLFMLSISTVFADYPTCLYGNPNYPIIYAHMSAASYLDKSSVTVKLNSYNDGLLFAQNHIYATFDRDVVNLKEVKPAKTVWFFKPWNSSKQGVSARNIDGRTIQLPPFTNTDVAYVSYDNANSWTPFYISNTAGYNMSTRNAFLLGYQVATGYVY